MQYCYFCIYYLISIFNRQLCWRVGNLWKHYINDKNSNLMDFSHRPFKCSFNGSMILVLVYLHVLQMNGLPLFCVRAVFNNNYIVNISWFETYFRSWILFHAVDWAPRPRGVDSFQPWIASAFIVRWILLHLLFCYVCFQEGCVGKGLWNEKEFRFYVRILFALYITTLWGNVDLKSNPKSKLTN